MDNAYLVAAAWIGLALLAEAARAMVADHRKILCVVDDAGALLGIVDRADLLRAAGAALAELPAIGEDDDDD